MRTGLRVRPEIPRGRAGRNGEQRKERGGRHISRERYGDDA